MFKKMKKRKEKVLSKDDFLKRQDKLFPDKGQVPNSELEKNILDRFSGQVILEFTFCMIIILLMIYGVTKAFYWTGRDFAERSRTHDGMLLSAIDEDYVSIGDGPLKQIYPDFYLPVKMDAIFDGN